MRKLPFCLIGLLILLGACGKNDQPADRTSLDSTEADSSVAIASNTPKVDSTQLLYTQKLKERKNPLPTSQVKEKSKVYPVDEAPLDTAFFLFREALIDALQNKEVFFVLDHVDEDIKNGFGDENGMANFVTAWQLDSPEKAENSELWRVLGTVLENGGVFGENRRAFYAPYYAPTWPGEYDPFEYGAIIGSGVRLRSEPGLNSKITKSVSHDVVHIEKWEDKWDTVDGEKHPWVRVKLLDDTEGYVYGKFLGTPIGFRAGFVKGSDGKWKMNYFLQGD